MEKVVLTHSRQLVQRDKLFRGKLELDVFPFLLERFEEPPLRLVRVVYNGTRLYVDDALHHFAATHAASVHVTLGCAGIVDEAVFVDELNDDEADEDENAEDGERAFRPLENSKVIRSLFRA